MGEDSLEMISLKLFLKLKIFMLLNYFFPPFVLGMLIFLLFALFFL